MGFMSEISEDVGWNECLDYLIEHLDDFHNSLSGGEYDYFPDDELKEYFKSLIK